MTSGIYAIANTANGKVYIGSSVDVPKRLAAHKAALAGERHHNEHLQRAWDKHGVGAFEFVILEEPVGEDDLVELEQVHIDILCSMDPARGYNQQEAGSKGRPSLATREKMSTAQMGNRSRLGIKHTAETRAKIGAANTGKKCTTETRAKIAATKRGKKHTAETRAKMSAARKGMTPSVEARAKQSAAKMGNQYWLGRTHSIEAREKIGAAKRGKTLSPEHRAKISATLKGRSRWT